MKNVFVTLVALVLLFACTPKKTTSNDNDGGGNIQSTVVELTGIALSEHEIMLEKGRNKVLEVKFTPGNATNKLLTWVSSNTSIATVNDGIVVAVGPGSTEIIVKSGNFTDKCQVTVKTVVPEGSVDLGIVMTRADGTTYKLYWAKSNLSESGLCSKPTDYGDYYAWGETEIKREYNQLFYKWGTSYSSRTADTFTKYGTVDNKTVLDPEDDVAHVKLGGKWRMPTDEEWTALRTKCTWTWTDKYNGIERKGIIVTGSNGNSIFLNFAGGSSSARFDGVGTYGYYWSSSLKTDDSAWSVSFSNARRVVWRDFDPRYFGQSVRPVTE